jgi:hypothetical protein
MTRCMSGTPGAASAPPPFSRDVVPSTSTVLSCPNRFVASWALPNHRLFFYQDAVPSLAYGECGLSRGSNIYTATCNPSGSD